MELPPIMGRSNLKKGQQSLIARFVVHSSVPSVHPVLVISASQYGDVEVHQEPTGERVQFRDSLHVADSVSRCIQGLENLGSVDKRC